MNPPVNFRPVGAALVLLAVLAGTYELAGRLPPPAATRRAAAFTRQLIVTDSAMADLTVTTHLSTDTAVATREAAATPLPAAPPPRLPPCPAQPIRFVPPVYTTGPPLGLHRYVGTVGGQPATALLAWRTPNAVSGSFYLHRGGPTYALIPGEYRGGQTVLRVLDQGEWRLASRPGAVLRGTWHDATGNHRLALRESYAGAVRADVHTLRLVGGAADQDSYSSTSCQAGSYEYTYLQFPALGTVAPALRRTLGRPAVVRHRLRALYKELVEQRRILTGFLLNDFGLLSYYVERFSADIGNSGHGDSWTEVYLFDLVTGRELTLASQLRPGYEQPLRRLIRRHLLHDSEFDFVNRQHRATWDWYDAAGKATKLVALPDADRYDDNGHAGGLLLSGSGLEINYHSYELYDASDNYLELGNQEYSLSIPYAELRPLVRPGTPLARMLRARGLW